MRKMSSWNERFSARSARLVMLSGAVFLTILVSQSFAQAEFKRTESLGPISIKYDALLELIHRVDNLLATTNAKATSIFEDRRELSLSNGPSQITISGVIGVEDLKNAPDSATDIYYSFRHYEAPISTVQITMTDFYRTI